MTLKKWLKPMDTCGLFCNIYIDNDDDPIYCGSMWDIPYHLVDLKIAKYSNPADKSEPIFYAHDIRKTINDEKGTKDYNGFIICLTEKEAEDD